MLISKHDLLLDLASEAVNWGEGADFEMVELLDCVNQEALRHYYPQFFKYSMNHEDYPDTDEGEVEWDKAEEWHGEHGYSSEAFRNLIKKDITVLLMSLKDNQS